MIYVSRFYVSLLNHEPYFYTSFLIQEPFPFRFFSISFLKRFDELATIQASYFNVSFLTQEITSSSRLFAISFPFRNDTNQSYRQDSRLSIRENGDEGGRWDLEEAYPSVFEDALESRRSLAVNVERQIAAARSKDGGSKRWRESFQPCARLT